MTFELKTGVLEKGGTTVMIGNDKIQGNIKSKIDNRITGKRKRTGQYPATVSYNNPAFWRLMQRLQWLSMHNVRKPTINIVAHSIIDFFFFFIWGSTKSASLTLTYYLPIKPVWLTC